MHIFSKYKERFIPSNQSDILDIVKNNEKMFQEYKEAFGREKIEGICGDLCNYIILNDLLANKKTFLKRFEDKKSLICDLIKKVKDGSVVSNIKNSKEFSDNINKLRDKIGAKIRTMPLSSQDELIEKIKTIKENFFVDIILKKPKVLTVECLESLLLGNSNNNYHSITFSTNEKSDKKSDHALLIKKNSDDKFTFYDPNYGAVFGLTKEELCDLITKTFYNYAIINKLNTIITSFIILSLVITGVTTAIHGINTPAIIASAMLLPVSLLTLSLFHFKSQYYSSICMHNTNLLGELDSCIAELKKIVSEDYIQKAKDTEQNKYGRCSCV